MTALNVRRCIVVDLDIGTYGEDPDADECAYLLRMGGIDADPVTVGETRTIADLPLDGTWEVFTAGCDDEGQWVTLTPNLNGIGALAESGLLVIARQVDNGSEAPS